MVSNQNCIRKIFVPGAFLFLASMAVIHSMASEILLSPPGLRLIKDPSLRNSFFKAFYPVNWTYARFKRDGNSSITSAKVLECHQCHSIAFHLTGDLIFTQFP